MNVFRWIMGVSGGLLVASWLFFFVVGLARDDKRQQEAAARLRQWGQLLFMFWFNIEIWGRVVWTIVNWR